MRTLESLWRIQQKLSEQVNGINEVTLNKMNKNMIKNTNKHRPQTKKRGNYKGYKLTDQDKFNVTKCAAKKK